MAQDDQRYVQKLRVDADFEQALVFATTTLASFIIELSVTAGGKKDDGTFLRDGDATMLLDNSGGEFDPFNTASVFFDKLLPRRRVRIYLNDILLWTGLIETIEPTLDDKNPIATLTLTQGRKELEDVEVSGTIHQSKDVSTIIANLMDENHYYPIIADDLFVLDSSPLDSASHLLPAAPSTFIVDSLGATLTLPYASDTWSGGYTLLDALTDLGEVERATAFMGVDGKITFLPYYHQNIATPAATINVDNDAQDAVWNTNPEPINEVQVKYHLRAVSLATTIFTITEALAEGDSRTHKLSSPDSEEEVSILSAPNFSEGLQLLSWDARSVEVYAKKDMASYTISADTLTIDDAAIVTKSLEPNVLKFRARYTKTLDIKLAQTRQIAEDIASKELTVISRPATYVDELTLVDQAPYYVGDTLSLVSKRLNGASPHLITGVAHEIAGVLITSTYTLLGSEAISVFILDDSVLDGEDEVI